ncbi:MAG: YkvA family protein [Clostridia bacterium]|nr:YkvA family protein [Clostridia bacterium]
MNKFKYCFQQFKSRARKLKNEVKALYLAYKHPEVPWYARFLILLVVGYALSPVDLIPDFIPVLGYLDDLILIPLGVSLAIKLIPSGVMEECRRQSEGVFRGKKPKNWIAGAVIIFIWLFFISFIVYKILRVVV